MHRPSLDRRTAFIGAASLFLGFGLTRAFTAEPSEIFTALVPGVGAGGYDVVAYHSGAGPTRGSSGFTARWKGATWRFANAQNRAAFVAEPERFAPAYGGHCAWAAAQGYKAKGDPRNWRVVEGRLFLNYDDAVQRMWEADIPSFIRKADAGWPDLARR